MCINFILNFSNILVQRIQQYVETLGNVLDAGNRDVMTVLGAFFGRCRRSSQQQQYAL